ncbi:hypothetical protein P154DRAFT_63601 [Amniculicola lignicola CBS 123094]|uniref:Uncharacterized protein n=1 Tax=Amniculicola lignicola CBS 123094 TaxID=1392246 RepID=A0A6A5WT53_9PLEO|nr:hypothetical protein P154DRAFT_63601 [Amniculicola lignicola CBS 123094]
MDADRTASWDQAVRDYIFGIASIPCPHTSRFKCRLSATCTRCSCPSVSLQPVRATSYLSPARRRNPLLYANGPEKLPAPAFLLRCLDRPLIPNRPSRFASLHVTHIISTSAPRPSLNLLSLTADLEPDKKQGDKMEQRPTEEGSPRGLICLPVVACRRDGPWCCGSEWEASPKSRAGWQLEAGIEQLNGGESC